MKTINYVLIIILLSVIVGGFYLWNKRKTKKQGDENDNVVDDGKKYIPSKQGSEQVKDMQRTLNNVLRKYDKELLVVDGIIGPKTKAAILFVSSVRNQTPDYGNITDDEGNTHTVNYNNVYRKLGDKAKNIGKYIPGYAWLTNLF